jgi:hypothetical protein
VIYLDAIWPQRGALSVSRLFKHVALASMADSLSAIHWLTRP